MNLDFSRFNLEYFLSVRDVAAENPAVAASIFGAQSDLIRSFAQLTPNQLASLTNVSVPLVVPRNEPTWWPRFIRALQDGTRSEVMTLAEEASFYLIQPERKRAL